MAVGFAHGDTPIGQTRLIHYSYLYKPHPIASSILTMPGLPKSPRSLDLDEQGNILGF
ncbi:MAG: hypothetical protein OXP37_10110 [Chloroflexota bacterium]|nr:hypothetical protein [Chloroflexota bacterium]